MTKHFENSGGHALPLNGDPRDAVFNLWLAVNAYRPEGAKTRMHERTAELREKSSPDDFKPLTAPVSGHAEVTTIFRRASATHSLGSPTDEMVRILSQVSEDELDKIITGTDPADSTAKQASPFTVLEGGRVEGQSGAAYAATTLPQLRIVQQDGPQAPSL